MRQIRQWIHDCEKNHPACNSSLEGPLPTRIINVGSAISGQNPYLYRSKGERQRYITLSYCWGDSLDYKTTTKNVAQLEQAIVLEEIPATFQDAIVVTRSLGVQFLWIDAVCMYSYRTAMKHLRNLRFMPQFSEVFNSPQSGKIMYYICFELSLITSFVRERERGYFNLARDERRGNIERAMVEPSRARGER